MNPINRYSLCLRLTFIIYCIALSSLSLTIAQSDNSNDIEITADKIEVLNNGNKIKATGNILIQTEDYLSSTDNLIYDKSKEIINSVGKVEGFISPIIKGENGFGYDPIFIPLGKKITFGEMRASQKYKIDHRFKAFKKIKKLF